MSFFFYSNCTDEEKKIIDTIEEAENLASRYGIELGSFYLPFNPSLKDAEDLLDAVERAYHRGEDHI